MWTSGLDALTLLGAILALAVVAAIWWRLRAAERRVDLLTEQLTVFTEASVRVARHVDETRTPAPAPVAAPHEPSRRYLLKRAMDERREGRDPREVASALRLSRDESRLLTLVGTVRV